MIRRRGYGTLHERRQMRLLTRPRHSRRPSRLARVRASAGVLVTAAILGCPARLAPVRWWRSPTVAASIGLTKAQREAIDRVYEQRLGPRRHCVERLVEASNRVDQLIRDGIYDDDVLRQTQAIASAATEQRILARVLNDEILAVLSPEQRGRLALMRARRAVD
jgi:hypothetical protein